MVRLDYAQARAEMSGIPRGVGGPPPPGMDPKRGKLMCIKVRMLDDTVAVFHLGHKALGQTLLDEVARHLNLLENDYFGLEFIDSMRNRCWLEKDKPILRQISALNSDAKFYFIVKFYSPNPVDVEEEYTRWLFALQVRRDLAMGDLQCSESTAALLAAYLVQSECGDFSAEDYPNASYLSNSRFIPHQTLEFQQKVMENHKNLIGMSPGESDLALLEVARRSDFYGIKFHVAKDIEGTEANLAVMHLGIKVFHQLHCVSTFSWAKIRKLSFKRKKMLIKLHPDSHQYYKETIEFLFETRNECKNFWKKCVEHHAFFRCTTVDDNKKDGKLFSKGSSFRYSGRTQKQLIDYVREHHKRREPFTRPLRSACPSRDAYSAAIYSTVSDKKRNGRTHASMPHLPPQPSAEAGTLDARSRRQSPNDRCTSDVDTDRQYTPLKKKKEVIYGVNSTFSTESLAVTEPIRKTDRHGLSISLTSNVDTSRSWIRSESSDSGAISILHESNYSRNEKSSSILSPPPFDAMECELEPETSSEQSDFYLEREDSIVGRRNYSKPLSSLPQIVKDFVDQERTVSKDLEIISESLFSRLQPLLDKCKVLGELFTVLSDILRSQKEFLTEINLLTSVDSTQLSDFPQRLLCSAHNLVPQYISLLQQYPIYISALDELAHSHVAFRAEILKLETSEECYLPINWLLLRIVHRMVEWQPVLARVVEQQLEDGKEGQDLTSSRVALEKVSQFAETTRQQRESLSEYVAFLQMEKELGAAGLLSHPSRRFLRVGWVERWSQKGLTPRILLLTSDRLILAHRSMADSPFSIQAEIKLKGMLVEDGDTYKVIGQRQDVITIHSGDKSIVFTSPNKEDWLQDLSSAVKNAAKCRLELPQLNWQRKEENEVAKSVDDESSRTRASPLFVCWHRHSSLGVDDIHRIVSCSQSGYLLRKLRNSSGWQKLWVVLAGHTLFFYKTHEDCSPLANLPLIDYGLGIPSLDDQILHENCFKLYYGTHKYYFRTDCQYTFQRWMASIRKCAISRQQVDLLTALSLRLQI